MHYGDYFGGVYWVNVGLKRSKLEVFRNYIRLHSVMLLKT